MGTKAFETQFQGHPTPAGGLTFREEWFRRYEGGIPKPIRIVSRESGHYGSTVEATRAVHVITAVDAAARTGTSNDWSVIATLATDMRDIFIVDIVRKRVEFVDLCHEIEEAATRWKSKRVYIESASSGIAAEQALRAHTRLNVIPIVAEKSKQARAEAVTPIFEAGRVHVPERAAWINTFMTEFLAFPAVRHDDQVDAVVLGINALSQIVESEQHVRSYQSQWRGIGR
jgi:predicted phage terminase large subunit-like protein